MWDFFKKNITPAPVEKRADTESTITAETLAAVLSGKTVVNAEMAMQIPAIAHCVNSIAATVAALPIRLYRMGEDGKPEEIKDDNRLTLLNSTTGDTLNADGMRYAWTKDLLLYGSAYSVIDKSRLYYVSPKNVAVMKYDGDIIKKHYTYNIQGRTYYPHNLLKILRSSDGFGKGSGIVSENSTLIDTAYNLLKFRKNQLLKGGNKKGFLKAESKLGNAAVNEIKSAWNKLYSNTDVDSESMVFLNSGVDFKEISSTAVEMQISELQQSIDDSIYSIFGMADGAIDEKTIKTAVMPILDIMEAAFDSDLLLESEKGSLYFAFDTRELTRGDTATRYNAYALALANNFLQLDEVRALEDLPPLGFNYIKLGLSDVLLDPKTGRIYTPNTNAMADLGSGGALTESVDGLEKRGEGGGKGNPYHAADGKFTTAEGEGLTNKAKSVRMSGKERARVSSGIATDFPRLAADGTVRKYEYGNYQYEFEVLEFGSYNFLSRKKIK